MDLPWGMFGENLTVTGLLDETVHIGDHIQVGSAKLMVTQPRLPCYKLGLKFGRDDRLGRNARYPLAKDSGSDFFRRHPVNGGIMGFFLSLIKGKFASLSLPFFFLRSE